MNGTRYDRVREQLVRESIEGRGIRDPRVLAALRQVPRHCFVPENLRDRAYENRPQDIGHDQTISQPYIVALMSEALGLGPARADGAGGSDRTGPSSRRPRVLEIGTGSGYQAAILDRMGAEVYTIEIVEPLSRQAERRLADLGCVHVRMRIGDGSRGWPEEAPFDGIIVTAAPETIPGPLEAQLAVGAHLIIPVGRYPNQRLLRRTRCRTPDDSLACREEDLGAVLFVPMTGEIRWGSSPRRRPRGV